MKLNKHVVVGMNKEIAGLTLECGMTLTLWLNKSKVKRDCNQLEIRVTKEGIIELFYDNNIKIKSFKEWKPLKE